MLALGNDYDNTQQNNALGSGAVTVSGGAQLRFGGASGGVVNYTTGNAITLNNGTLFANDGIQRLTGGLTVAPGGGTLTVQWADKPIFVDGAVSGLGLLTINSINGNGSVIFTQGGTINGLTGSGALTKSGANTLTLTGPGNFSGGTMVNEGTLSLEPTTNRGALNGTVTVNSGGTLRIAGANWVGFGEVSGAKINTLNIVGGTVNNTLNTSFITDAVVNMAGGTISGEEINWRSTTVNTLATSSTATIQSNLFIRNDFSPGVALAFDVADGFAATDLLVSGNIREAVSGGSLIKRGAGTLTLTGANTYTGATTVASGTLSCSTSNALGSGPLSISSGGAKMNLSYSGTKSILSLTLGGVAQPNGTYGSSTSPATRKNDIYFSGTGTVNVGPTNTAPVATARSSSTLEDTSVPITLSATDAEGNPLTYSVLTQPANGTLSGNAPNLTYIPAANFNGADGFTFKANDGALDSTPATVSITVTAVNDAPVFTTNPIVAAVASVSVAYTGQTLAGRATDADAGAAITYSKVSGPAWLAVASNGTLSGTPPSGSTGLNSFVVRATDNASATVTATLQITVTSLPLPWVASNIGTGMLAGSTTHNAGTFTQAGSGTLGTNSDKLSFAYQTLTGDGEISARISLLHNTGTSSRVGVMIRDTLAPNSKQIFMGMSDNNSYKWVRRTTLNGDNTTTAGGPGIVPNTWVRLVRSGTTITAYKSTDGIAWTTVGITTGTTFEPNCYIGLAVSSGSDTTLNTSRFSNLKVDP